MKSLRTVCLALDLNIFFFFFPVSFIVLHFIFKLIFVWSLKLRSVFIFLLMNVQLSSTICTNGYLPFNPFLTNHFVKKILGIFVWVSFWVLCSVSLTFMSVPLSVPHSHDFCCSVPQLCLTPCDPMDSSTPGSPVLHYLLKFAQIHVH